MEVLNQAEFTRALSGAFHRMQLQTEHDLVVLGLRVQSRARELAPVDTGRLRASIVSSGLERDARGAFVRIGTNVFYAGFVEFGTRYMAPQPYLRPALLEAAQAWGRG